jgi:DNA-binding response OmpR family regulator
MNILLADDDKNFGLVLKNELQEETYAVDLVANGVEAVTSFIEKSHDFVLLDLVMPRLSGNDTLRIIKKINPSVPVICFSGVSGDWEKEECIACGAIACLSKPFEIAQLKADIRKYMDPFQIPSYPPFPKGVL